MKYYASSEQERCLIKKLEVSFNLKTTANTNLDVDRVLNRAKQGDIQSKNWLLINFLPFIVSTATSRVIKVKNPFSGQIEKITFQSALTESDTEDLLSHLVEKFTLYIDEFDWSSAFNFWIEMKIKWATINYRNNIRKIQSRETSLDESITRAESDSEELKLSDIIDSRDGIWNNKLTSLEVIEDNNIIEIVNNEIKSKFNNEEYEIFRLHFVEGLSIIEITTKFKKSYHSGISSTISLLKDHLRVFLSKLDSVYDEMYIKFQEQENKKRRCISDMPKNIDIECKDLIPIFEPMPDIESILNKINNGENNE